MRPRYTESGWAFGIVLALSMPTAATAGAQASASEDEARGFFEEGRGAYSAGRFVEAARAFRRAYLLSGHAALLYNVGQAELRAGHDSLALEAFEGYLRRTPDPSDTRSEIEERVRVLRSMGVVPATEREVEAAAQAAQAARGEQGSASDPSPWIVFGACLAAMIPAPILLSVAADSASRVTQAPDGSTWRGDLEDVASEADAMWIAGWIVLGVAAAAATAGLVWALSSDRSGASAELRLAPNGVTLAGTFR